MDAHPSDVKNRISELEHDKHRHLMQQHTTMTTMTTCEHIWSDEKEKELSYLKRVQKQIDALFTH